MRGRKSSRLIETKAYQLVVLVVKEKKSSSTVPRCFAPKSYHSVSINLLGNEKAISGYILWHEPRVEQPVRQGSVAAQQQQAAAVRIQAPHRVMPDDRRKQPEKVNLCLHAS